MKKLLSQRDMRKILVIRYSLPLALCCSLLTFVILAATMLFPAALPVLSSNHLFNPSKELPVIVIDAGHGGGDPGKIGTAGTQEKEINLKIALYLKEILQSQDLKVILTRQEDTSLSTDPRHWKLSDLKERVSLIETSHAALVVSIHQNSYTDPKVYGAQCFYYTGSEKGKFLADCLQKQIISSTRQTKIREIKSNNDYYILKNSHVPTVIAECGFLSNPEEEQLLVSEKYQRKMAWAIHLGILQYLNAHR